MEVALGRDGRRARAHVDQGDVAEVVAGPEAPALLAADGHDGLPALDHEEPCGALALDRHGVARVEHPLLERAAQALELTPGEPREQRDFLEQLDGWPGHAGD